MLSKLLKFLDHFSRFYVGTWEKTFWRIQWISLQPILDAFSVGTFIMWWCPSTTENCKWLSAEKSRWGMLSTNSVCGFKVSIIEFKCQTVRLAVFRVILFSSYFIFNFFLATQGNQTISYKYGNTLQLRLGSAANYVSSINCYRCTCVFLNMCIFKAIYHFRRSKRQVYGIIFNCSFSIIGNI